MLGWLFFVGGFFLAFFFCLDVCSRLRRGGNECVTLTGNCCEHESPCGDFVEHFWTMYTESVNIWIRRNWKDILG